MDVFFQYSAALIHTGKTWKEKKVSSYVTVTKHVNTPHIQIT